MATPQPKRKKKKVAVKVPTLSTVRKPRADLDVGNLRLQGKKLSAKLTGSITDATIETTIQGAATLTLTVSDWGEGLLHSKLIQGKCELTFDGESFTLVKISRTGGVNMQLVFEDTAANLLRQYKGPLKANRAKVTRAQFVREMVNEVTQARIPFRSPEINQKQPIAGS